MMAFSSSSAIGSRQDMASVAQHRDAIGQMHDLVDAVRDIDDGDAVRRRAAG